MPRFWEGGRGGWCPTAATQKLDELAEHCDLHPTSIRNGKTLRLAGPETVFTDGPDERRYDR